jgi:hypothetical protein
MSCGRSKLSLDEKNNLSELDTLHSTKNYNLTLIDNNINKIRKSESNIDIG